jgi:PAS domain S-box-containing protein
MKADASGQACSGSRDGNQLAVDDLRQFQTIVEAIKSAVLIYQGDTICYANPHTESLTGYCSDELLAMPFWAFAHPDFQDMVQQRGRARQAGESVPDNYDFMFVRKDGEVRWVNWRAIRVCAVRCCCSKVTSSCMQARPACRKPIAKL